MDDVTREKIERAALKNGTAFGLGVGIGAVAKRPSHSGPLLGQVGSAVGASLATGGGVAAAAGAGANVVAGAAIAAKAAVVGAAVVGAPIVGGIALIGAIGWGISKLIED